MGRKWAIGCLVALPLAGVGLYILIQEACEPRLQVLIDSAPPGARITIEGTDTGRRTPARVSYRFPASGKDERHSKYDVTLEEEGQAARGRVFAWYAGSLYGVFTTRVESRDGSAWHLSAKEGYEVRFAKEGSSFLVLDRRSSQDPAYDLDGEARSSASLSICEQLKAGRHSVSVADWKADLDLDEGFCIQISEGEDEVSLEPGQFTRAARVLPDGAELAEDRPSPLFRTRGEPAHLVFDARDGRRCRLTLTLRRSEPHLHLRVTAGEPARRAPAAPGR